MKKFVLFALLLFIYNLLPAQSKRPGIGLTLSGGGAKGLAHIGILKAIDSAGLNINYITGTSMGSIMGALYAAGYSGDSIEQIARNINWDVLLSNQSQLRSFIMEEKSEYGRYAVELPFVRGRFKFSSGLLEGEELWLKFYELFFPVYKIVDFNDFPIPFKCIATDLSNGKAVVLDSGNIVTAIRASMAIPSVFTAVNYNGKFLVDGGLIRNYPASDVKNMGADYIIGSDVASGLKPPNRLSSPIDVLMQIAFFKEADLRPSEDSLCNINIKHNIGKYNSASFYSAEAIIDSGIVMGRRYYPYFKKLADSLNAIYGPAELNVRHVNKDTIVVIDSVVITGLKHTDKNFVKKMMQMDLHKAYREKKISEKIRNIFGTRNYNKITYQLQPTGEEGHAIMHVNARENPQATAKFSLHYNKATGVSAIGNLTTRNWLFQKSRDLVTVNIGDNMKIRGEHLQLLGKEAGSGALLLDGYTERQELTIYTDYRPDGLYLQRYSHLGARLQLSRFRTTTVGIGSKYEWTSFRPKIPSIETIDGKNRNWNSFAYLQHNTLDKNILPKNGIRLNGYFNYIYKQRTDATIKFPDGSVYRLDSLGISFGNYARIHFIFEGYNTFRNKNTFSQMVQGGLLFNNTQTLFNDFFVGGLNDVIRNQVLFAGVPESSIMTASFVTYQWAWRKMWTTSIYTTLRANTMMYDFLKNRNRFENPFWLTGASASVGYVSPLGPLEFSLMYADKSRILSTYINLGFSF